jgi:hypothetical protein
MKKVVMFALLFAAVAAMSASAQTPPPLQPLANHLYYCDYTNPSMGESDPGTSSFSFIYTNTTSLKQGIEYYDVPGRTENRKVTFAKPVNHYYQGVVTWTDWEFTINPSGPQCAARVTNGGISFTNCTDGSSRSCYAF